MKKFLKKHSPTVFAYYFVVTMKMVLKKARMFLNRYPWSSNFLKFHLSKIPKENGKENGLKYSMIIRNDSRYSIKVRIVDVRIFFWENGFRWWLFARLVLRDPLYDSERFKESYYNYPLTFFKNKVEMSLFFTPKILRKCHYLHTTKIWSYMWT